MPLQIINFGGYDNDPSADKVRVAFQKAQEMFSELYDNISVTGLDGYALKAVYDPTNKQADAFSMANMAETATKVVMTKTERDNLATLVAAGPHSTAGYLTQYTETEPAFTAWLAANTFKVESYTATASQTVQAVAQGAIVDNGRAKVWVNGIRWYSTNGVASFSDGLITINFSTGVITFNEALRAGDKIIVEYI